MAFATQSITVHFGYQPEGVTTNRVFLNLGIFLQAMVHLSRLWHPSLHAPGPLQQIL